MVIEIDHPAPAEPGTLTRINIMYSIEQLQAAGGKIWEKNDMRRAYFNDLDKLFGLERINGKMHLDGEEMSRKYASRAQMMVSEGKLWYDLTTGEFCHRGIDSDEAVEKMVSRIKERIGA